MNEAAAILLRVALAFALAVAGGVSSAFIGRSHKRLCALISFAAGTLLGVTLFAILPESWEATGGWKLALALASGYAGFFLLSKYVHHVCPACAASHFDEQATHRFREIATALIVALAIHSTTDGIALAAGHETHGAPGSPDPALGWSLLVAICVHKIPEGLALGALLLGAGFRKPAAVAWVAVAEGTTLLGGLLGVWFLGDASPLWLGVILAYVGGGFLYLAGHAVLGEMMKHGKSLVLANFVVGLALIAAVRFASER
jgi:zinc transporter ZupT